MKNQINPFRYKTCLQTEAFFKLIRYNKGLTRNYKINYMVNKETIKL